jgi:DNA-directed RNA polymerase subunit RPC12/RpoP
VSALPLVYTDDEPEVLRCEACSSANTFTDSRSYPSGVAFLGTAEWMASEYLFCPDCGHIEEL